MANFNRTLAEAMQSYLMKKTSVLLLIFISLSVMGCALIMGEVSTATNNHPSQDSTFAIFSNTMPTLTEQKIQGYIIAKLSSLGFRQIDDIQKANYIVVYSYDIGSGQTYTTVTSSPDFVFGGKNISSASHTKYPRYFQIGLVDREASVTANKLVFAFQGEVYSTGASSNAAYLSKYFVDQIFSNYGQNVDNKRFAVNPWAIINDEDGR